MPHGDVDLFLIPYEEDLGGGRRMVSSGPEFGKGEVGVEEDDEDPQQGRYRVVGVWIFL